MGTLSAISPSAGMQFTSALVRVFVGLFLLTILSSRAIAQSQTPNTGTEVWPELDAHFQLASNLRMVSFAGTEQAAGFAYQQWYAAGAVGYQVKRILRPHLENIDPDKEHYLVLAGGYEFLQSTQSAKTKNEDRMVLQALSGFRPSAALLVSDRSRVEFRWINGTYSTTYRNKLALERDFLLRRVRFTPEAGAEFFYSGAKNSWNQQWYTAGIQWPYKHLFMLDTYYLRQNCPTCSPANLNVAGVTLNFYFGNSK